MDRKQNLIITIERLWIFQYFSGQNVSITIKYGQKINKKKQTHLKTIILKTIVKVSNNKAFT